METTPVVVVMIPASVQYNCTAPCSGQDKGTPSMQLAISLIVVAAILSFLSLAVWWRRRKMRKSRAGQFAVEAKQTQSQATPSDLRLTRQRRAMAHKGFHSDAQKGPYPDWQRPAMDPHYDNVMTTALDGHGPAQCEEPEQKCMESDCTPTPYSIYENSTAIYSNYAMLGLGPNDAEAIYVFPDGLIQHRLACDQA